MSLPPPASPRRRIDLHRTLSAPARWALALLIVGVVALLAVWQGHDRPVPAWIEEGLVPALGWIWLGLAALALVGVGLPAWRRALRRRAAARAARREGHDREGERP